MCFCLQNGVLLVGGNSWHKVPISIHCLAANNLSVIGLKNGTKEQLQELVNVIAQGQVSTAFWVLVAWHSGY